MKIAVSELYEICTKILVKNGVPNEHSQIIADSIVYAHRSGKSTHGATRLGIYVSKIKNGFLNPDTPVNVVSDKGAITIYDACHGFGQVAAYQAIISSIKKSTSTGIGLTAVRHSNNFGTAAFFAKMAIEAGKIALIFTNSAPAIAPWGASKPIFGTNPIAAGFPTPDGSPPIILDMAVSNVARGKIRLAAKQGEKIPFGWALDPDGKPTDDPNLAILGSMIPIGEYKGSGLSMVVDLLAGLLTGAGYAGGVKPLNTKDDYSNNGHLFIIIDPKFFFNDESYNERMKSFIKNIKDNTNGDDVYMPGEQSFKNEEENIEFVEISEKVLLEIKALQAD